MQTLALDLAASPNTAPHPTNFLQRLAAQGHMALTACPASTQESLSQLAANIMGVGFPSVATLRHAQDPSPNSTASGASYARLLAANEELSGKAEQLTAQVATFHTNQPRPLSRTRRPSPNHSGRRS
ncbi:hypothetical protein HPB52_005405 [Rhipicephalus sanguineus]|uniref:Uncharacterized protein n=1 Tax=Rhipicephalus sanguineus TaxID=34632 RepID=A0A9D4Q9Y4_RHISA|nr:hypothetical protein HPB52_005405 [Rhipicephalus sanguineus]